MIVNTEDQLPQNADVRLFPNPAKEVVQLQAEDAWIEHVQVFDLSGKLLLEQSLNQYSQTKLRIDQLPKGMHLVMVYTDKGSSQHTLVIQ